MKNLNPRVFRPLTPPSTKSLFPSTVKKQGPLNLRTISDFLTPLHHCGNSADMKLKTCPCVKAPSCWPAGFFSHLLRRVDVFWDMHMLILFYASSPSSPACETLNGIFTARKRSLRRLCFYRCLSFCPQGEGHAWLVWGGRAW